MENKPKIIFLPFAKDYKNLDIVGGLSFLPRQNHVYKLAPYEAIDQETYEELSKQMGDIDFSKIVDRIFVPSNYIF